MRVEGVDAPVESPAPHPRRVRSCLARAREEVALPSRPPRSRVEDLGGAAHARDGHAEGSGEAAHGLQILLRRTPPGAWRLSASVERVGTRRPAKRTGSSLLVVSPPTLPKTRSSVSASYRRGYRTPSPSSPHTLPMSAAVREAPLEAVVGRSAVPPREDHPVEARVAAGNAKTLGASAGPLARAQAVGRVVFDRRTRADRARDARRPGRTAEGRLQGVIAPRAFAFDSVSAAPTRLRSW